MLRSKVAIDAVSSEDGQDTFNSYVKKNKGGKEGFLESIGSSITGKKYAIGADMAAYDYNDMYDPNNESWNLSDATTEQLKKMGEDLPIDIAVMAASAVTGNWAATGIRALRFANSIHKLYKASKLLRYAIGAGAIIADMAVSEIADQTIRKFVLGQDIPFKLTSFLAHSIGMYGGMKYVAGGGQKLLRPALGGKGASVFSLLGIEAPFNMAITNIMGEAQGSLGEQYGHAVFNMLKGRVSMGLMHKATGGRLMKAEHKYYEDVENIKTAEMTLNKDKGKYRTILHNEGVRGAFVTLMTEFNGKYQAFLDKSPRLAKLLPKDLLKIRFIPIPQMAAILGARFVAVDDLAGRQSGQLVLDNGRVVKTNEASGTIGEGTINRATERNKRGAAAKRRQGHEFREGDVDTNTEFQRLGFNNGDEVAVLRKSRKVETGWAIDYVLPGSKLIKVIKISGDGIGSSKKIPISDIVNRNRKGPKSKANHDLVDIARNISWYHGYKFQEGDTVNVKRTNGQIESDWMIAGKPQSDGTIKVMNPEGSWKPIAIKDLLNLNSNGPLKKGTLPPTPALRKTNQPRPADENPNVTFHKLGFRRGDEVLVKRGSGEVEKGWAIDYVHPGMKYVQVIKINGGEIGSTKKIPVKDINSHNPKGAKSKAKDTQLDTARNIHWYNGHKFKVDDNIVVVKKDGTLENRRIASSPDEKGNVYVMDAKGKARLVNVKDILKLNSAGPNKEISPKDYDNLVLETNRQQMTPDMKDAIEKGGETVSEGGRTVRMYEGEHIADGCFGAVHQVYYTEGSSTVLKKGAVVKTPHDSDNARTNMKFEADAARGVMNIHLHDTHPDSKHLVKPLFTSGRVIIYEKISMKGDLGENLSKMKPKEWLVQLIGGVKGAAYMNRNGIAHNDIKPENIVVGPNGGVLIDLGAAVKKTDIGTKVQVRGARRGQTGSAHYIDDAGKHHWVQQDARFNDSNLLAQSVNQGRPLDMGDKYAFGRSIETLVRHHNYPGQKVMSPKTIKQLTDLANKLLNVESHPYKYIDNDPSKGLDPNYVSLQDLPNTLATIAKQM
ncbi:hypothetical protein ACFL3T_02675 [Patescibacteria group bacterium]